jgi:DNA-binding SARP family transcriptional activator/class 3 adenylate cyclase
VDTHPGRSSGAASLPGGTVTLLFSDIEGSTRLLKRLGGGYGQVLVDHARILREAFAGSGGREVDSQGDSFFAVFSRASDAVGAAVDVQRRLAAVSWPGDAEVRVRIGIHTGEPATAEDRYVGLDVHRAARICAAAHGGQVLVSHLSAGLIGSQLPEGVSLRPLGLVRLKDLDEPEQLSQLVIDGLRKHYPPLRSISAEPSAAAEVLAAEVASAVLTEGRPQVEIGVLGPVQVVREGVTVTVGAAKQRMILAALALRLGEVVSVDALIDTLWGEKPPATATKALQVYVSELRRAVEPERRTHGVIVSQAPGYRLVLPPDATDLGRFERLWREGREAFALGAVDDAAARMREALALWRGAPLADLSYEDAFSLEIGRLDELRVACTEDRIDAELALGQQDHLVPDLERLVREHPLRERLHGQLMLALYRSGRQADALAAYQRTREHLVDGLGIDPSPALARLERRILQQDPDLDLAGDAGGTSPAAVVAAPTRTLLVVSQSSRDVDALVAIGAAITQGSDDRDLVLARLVTVLPGQDPRERLRDVTRRLAERRDELLGRGVDARVAAFSTNSPGADLLKLAGHQDADLLVLDGTPALIEGRSGLADELLARAECDVALHLAREVAPPGDALLVPFSGSEHDWAALELAALLARRSGASLILAGLAAGDDNDRDASRLLATASLVLQRTSGTVCEPVLISRGADGLLAAAGEAGHIVVGLSPRFREHGLGETRHRVAQEAPTPVTFVRRGTRPGVLAPAETLTRFSWSVTTSRA